MLRSECVHENGKKAEDLSLATMPFTDRKVFGAEKLALAERPLSEVTGTSLQWISLFANRFLAECLHEFCKGRRAN